MTTVDFLDQMRKICNELSTVNKDEKIGKGETQLVTYYNIPASYDSETTSMVTLKVAHVYAWMFGIGEWCTMGRTLFEFQLFMRKLSQILGLGETKRLIVYVHNLAFDFEFFQDLFTYSKFFAVDAHKPVDVRTTIGFEFKDSLILAGGIGLEKWAEGLTHHPDARKKVGQLDYKKIRNSKTPLSDKEVEYNLYDVYTLNCCIAEEMEINHNRICDIPLTKTGYVRRYLRKACNRVDTYADYRKLMRRCWLTKEMYQMWSQYIMGGFTHANCLNLENPDSPDGAWGDVASFDFTSSYPAVMLSERYPMGRETKVKIRNFSEYNYHVKEKHRILICNIRFKNFEVRDMCPDTPISVSKCRNIVGKIVVDNGRIMKCYQSDPEKDATFDTTLTNVDLEYILPCLKNTTELCFGDCYYYETDYLPKPIVKSVLDFYVGKTELKDVEEKVQEYQVKKGMLNAIYGEMVMDIIRGQINYIDGKYFKEVSDLDKEIVKYNTSQNRVTYFPWGAMIAAYARRNLWMGILSCGKDYIYSDTDSVKILNYEDHMDFIESYNKMITAKIDACLDHYGIDREKARPKTIKGKVKQLGVWDFEGVYEKFKTLGAKRYITQKDGKFSITVAGLPKKAGAKYLMKEAEKMTKKTGEEVTPFDIFKNEMRVPETDSEKNVHYYMNGEYVDYDSEDEFGNIEHHHVRFGVCLVPTGFGMALAPEYVALIRQIMDMKKRA